MQLVVHVHDLPMWSLPDDQVDRIRRALPGVEVVCARSADEAASALRTADVALAPRMTPEALATAERLRWVHSTAVGVSWLPLEALAARGIPVTNSRGVHAEMLAEHAIALLLAVRRLLPQAEEARRGRVWAQETLSRVSTPRLSASMALVIGVGAVGARVARGLAALGMRVKGVRRRASLPVDGLTDIVTLDAIDRYLPDADAVVLALPHTAETGVVLTRERLELLRPSAVVVNVARGSLVDEQALADLLLTGRIGGAGLDVFAREPLPADSPLWTTPRTMLTPHTGAFDGDYWTPAVDCFLDHWRDFVEGRPLANQVDGY